LFKELGFRTLSERVKKVMGAPVAEPIKKNKEVAQNQIAFDSDEAKELCLMLWVIDSNITNPKVEDVLNFTRADALPEARAVLEKELDKRGVRKVFEEVEKPLMPVVDEMNKTGVKVDPAILAELSTTYHKKLKELEKKIWKLAGEEFNVN